MEIVKSKKINLVVVLFSVLFLFIGGCAFAQNKVDSIDTSYFSNDSSLVIKIKYDFDVKNYIYDRLDAKVVFDGDAEITFINIQFDDKSKELIINIPKSQFYVINKRVKTEVFTKFHLIGDVETYSYGYYLEIL